MFGVKWRQRANILDNDFPKDKWKYQDYDIIKGTVTRSLQHTFDDKD